MDWAWAQTQCPAGHPATWPRVSRHYESCRDCPASVDGRGHFDLLCEPCGHVWYLPPDCRRSVAERDH